MRALYNRILPWSHGYHHCNSGLDEFYQIIGNFKIISVNNQMLDFKRLGTFRISRFIRDPRDLVVSGYFYHKRGAEQWCNIVDPNEEDWTNVNGTLPTGMEKGLSFSSYLQSLSEEDGIIAEIQFRKHHFESMLEWPIQDSKIKVFRYEDIIGNEMYIFRKLFEFYELPLLDRTLGLLLSKKYSAKRQQQKAYRHIRNPESNQWKKYFTPKVNDYFIGKYQELLTILGY